VRQFPAVNFGQMRSGYANLFFDQVKIIQKPFFRRCDTEIVLNGIRQDVPDLKQDIFIIR
jgi:hypothetical protein